MKSRIFVLIFILALMGCSHKYINAEKMRPADMAYIPEGWFDMGSNGDEGRVGMAIGVDEIPKHKVFVKGFYMDRFEITNKQFYDFLNATDNDYRPSHWEEMATFEKGEDDHPVVDVDWMDGDEYCRWKGKRLPTEIEWEKAARGTDNRLWPWGNEYDTTKANTRESKRHWTSVVGSYLGDVSPYGVYDMTGNVREWVSGWYYPYPGNNLPTGRYTGPYRVLRGGSYDTPLYRYARVSSRFAISSTLATRGHNWHSNFDHGFRCVKDL